MKKKHAELLALLLMALGVVMVCQPLIHAFFAWGFLVTIAGIVAFNVAARMKEDA